MGPKKERVRKRRDDGTQYYCYLCNTDTAYCASKLTAHAAAEHEGSKIYWRKVEDFIKLSFPCDVCEYISDTLMESTAHLDTHEVQHKCAECHKQFKKTLDYAMHIFEHTKVPKCELCSAMFKDRVRLQTHYATHLNSLNPYQCTMAGCTRRFHVAGLFKDHLKRHAKVREYQCDLCPSNFVTDSALKHHLMTIHSKAVLGEELSYECKECNLQFKHVVTFKRHNVRLHSSKREVCHQCGREFFSMYALRQHMFHHGDKQLKCRFCDKTFFLKKGLRSHEVIHTGEKRFPCRYCDKRFGQSNVRKTHERLHTNERPFKCDFCGKGYTSRAARNSHQNSCLQTTHQQHTEKREERIQWLPVVQHSI